MKRFWWVRYRKSTRSGGSGRRRSPSMPTRHIALALAVAVVWGVNFVVIDVGLDSWPPLLFAALRFTLIAFPAVLLVGRPRVHWKWVVAVGAFLSAGQFGLLFVDWMKGNPGVRAEYLDLKRRVSAQEHVTTGAYADAKEPWFLDAYRRAWEWADATGWRPGGPAQARRGPRAHARQRHSKSRRAPSATR